MIILTFTVYSDERETTRIAFAPVFQNKKLKHMLDSKNIKIVIIMILKAK
jgi:hypothetical protein